MYSYIHRRARERASEAMMNADAEAGDDYVREIYGWLDEIPLSRPKRNVARDFSDGGRKRVDFFSGLVGGGVGNMVNVSWLVLMDGIFMF